MLHHDVDFDKSGKQIGFLDVPYSEHDDAWGVIRVPIAVIANGEGSTVILEGGNHGDEYEGPIALGELIRELDPAQVAGRLIFIPAINLPAVAVASRVSPIDGINMNRAFPGDPLGTTTQQIVSFVNDTLFPMADAFLDLHSGGSSLDILPSAIIQPSPDPSQHAKNVAAVSAFGAPINVTIDNRGDPRTATSAAAAAGLIVVATEMAGGGTVSTDALNLCRRGVRNVLVHLGVLPPEFACTLENQPKNFVLAPGAHILAHEDGVFEPIHRLGTKVRAGDLAGRIHFLANPGRKPVELRYSTDGLLYGVRQPGRVRPGNCCLVVATPCG